MLKKTSFIVNRLRQQRAQFIQMRSVPYDGLYAQCLCHYHCGHLIPWLILSFIDLHMTTYKCSVHDFPEHLNNCLKASCFRAPARQPSSQPYNRHRHFTAADTGKIIENMGVGVKCFLLATVHSNRDESDIAAPSSNSVFAWCHCAPRRLHQ